MKSVKTLALVAALCAAMMALTACGNEPAKKSEEQKQAAPATTVEQKKEEPKKDEAKKTETLASWSGVWDDISVYINDPKFEESFKKKSERENGKQTPEEIKEALLKKRESEIRGIEFDGNKIKFYDNFKSKGGKVISEAEYEYMGGHEVEHGNGMKLELSEWKAKDPNAKYPVLLLLPPHGEESLTHFHMRYGNNVAELLAKDKWYPTFIKPSSTEEQLKEEFEE